MLRSHLRNALNHLLALAGYELHPRNRTRPAFGIDAVLQRLTDRKTQVGTVIDVGAASGRWTRKAIRHFPDASFLMVEPLEERRHALEALCAANDRFQFVSAAAGDRPGCAMLNVASDLDGSGIYGTGSGSSQRQVSVTTIDAEVERLKLPAPYFLKLDTHGFELPILEGARETLRQASVLLIEVYNFQLTDGSVRFHELCAHLEKCGFRCADLADPMVRPLDGLLWQMDLVFLPSTSPCFSERGFARPASPLGRLAVC